MQDLTPNSRGEPLDDPVERLVGERVNFSVGQELDRGWDVHKAKLGHPEDPCLLQRLVDERLRSDSRRRDAAPLESYQVVHTARHARASVAERLDGEVAV
jgi:hypothetical protein